MTNDIKKQDNPNLHDTPDAEIWVQEWQRIIKEHPEIPYDPGAMVGWFANAIMAGYDAGIRKARLERTPEEPW